MTPEDYARQYNEAVIRYSSDDETPPSHIDALMKSLNSEDKIWYGQHSPPVRRMMLADALRDEGREREAEMTASPGHITVYHGKIRPAFEAYGWPGGYSVVHIMQDAGVMCADCMNGENGSETPTPDVKGDPQWTHAYSFPHFEGAPEQCDHCGKEIPSAYGEVD